MATSMTPPSTGELLHLSMDDLLGPFPETFRLGGAGPFVINLRSSNVSMIPLPSALPGFDHLHLYQIQRLEDDVLRYRLRLGPFSSEEDADAVLLKVRDSYPCALTATAVADDLQAIEVQQQPKTRAAASNAARVATMAAAPLSPVLTPTPTVVSATPPAAAMATSPATATTPATTVTSASPDPAPTMIAPVAKATTPPGPVARLTPAELSAQSLRWFVIELSATDQSVDPETVPNLDIYDLYRLYLVTEVVDGRRVHSLRLGFFGEEIAAKAVAAYLAGYYDKPTIKRVSVAERERFSQQGIEARKDVGATGRHAAIEITADRLARPIRRQVTPPP